MMEEYYLILPDGSTTPISSYKAKSLEENGTAVCTHSQRVGEALVERFYELTTMRWNEEKELGE